MDFSPPTPASNVTPVRSRLDDDDTRKRKSVCTPTRPTTPQNDRATPSNRPPSGPRSFVLPQNPYRRSSQPQSDVFIADTSRASTPQVQRSHAISVTPVSSAKKTRATAAHSSTKSQSNITGKTFMLSTSELYKPFRECVANLDTDVDADTGSGTGADADVVADVDANVDADEDTDPDAGADADADDDDDADIVAQLLANTGVNSPVLPVPAFDYNDFDTKAYSLMRNHFIHTRISTKQKKATGNERVLRSVVTQNLFNEDCDDEAINVTTTDTRRLSRLLLEDFIVLPVMTPLLLMIPTAGSPWSALVESGIDYQQEPATVVRMGGIDFYKVMGHILSANLALELTTGYLSESQLNICFKQNDGVSIQIDGGSSFQLSWKQFISNPKDILIFGAPLVSNRDFYRTLRFVKTMPSLHMLWRQLFNETFGDAFQSLFINYLSKTQYI
jgi:hypothetical protein